MGESVLETIGTPVFANKKLAEIPSLEAFSVGIQPFEARDEEIQSKGTFRKLMNSLKLIREEVENPDVIIDCVVKLSQPEVQEESSQSSISSFRKSTKKNKKKKKSKPYLAKNKF